MLERDRHSVSLTAAGFAFLAEARDVIARAERSVAIARAVADGRMGRIRLACGPGAFDARLADVIRRFSIASPDVTFDVRIECDAASIEAVRAEHADVALVHELEANVARAFALSGTPFVSQPLSVAVGAGHAVACAERLTARDLRGARVLTTSEAAYPALHRAVRDLCAEGGEEPPDLHGIDDPIALLGMAAAGFGIAVVPASWKRLAPETVCTVPINAPAPVVALVLYRRSDLRNATVDAFEPYILPGNIM